MENDKDKNTILTGEWLKANGWRNVDTNTFNKDINGITYYLVYNNWRVTSIGQALKGSIASGHSISDDLTYTLLKGIACINSAQVLEMLTLTGKEYEEEKDTYIRANEGDELISRKWLPNNGWRRTFTGDFHKCVNNVWYELEYTDYACDFMLKREIARLQTVKELEELTKL